MTRILVIPLSLLLLVGAQAQKVLIAGNGSQNVGVYDLNGNQISLHPVGFQPADIAVDVAGDVYVTDNNGFVKRFDSNFNLITSWSRGTTTYGIAVRPSSQNIFICGSGAATVREYDNNGNFIQDWNPGGGNLRDIAFDSNDNMWVTSFGCNCVQVVNPGGGIISSVGGTNAPFGIANGPGNLLYVNGQNDHQVYEMNEMFSIVNSFLPTGFPGQLRNLGVDNLGQIWLGHNSSSQVDVYNTGGGSLFSFNAPGQSSIHSVVFAGTFGGGGTPPPGAPAGSTGALILTVSLLALALGVLTRKTA